MVSTGRDRKMSFGGKVGVSTQGQTFRQRESATPEALNSQLKECWLASKLPENSNRLGFSESISTGWEWRVPAPLTLSVLPNATKGPTAKRAENGNRNFGRVRVDDRIAAGVPRGTNSKTDKTMEPMASGCGRNYERGAVFKGRRTRLLGKGGIRRSGRCEGNVLSSRKGRSKGEADIGWCATADLLRNSGRAALGSVGDAARERAREQGGKAPELGYLWEDIGTSLDT
ncbi:hypothetical protein VTK56DRAFT_526 [Thermocarpiscus australiensis]